jgi:hypothetical protein
MRNGLVNLGSLFQMLFMELSTFMLQSREQIRVKSVDLYRTKSKARETAV